MHRQISELRKVLGEEARIDTRSPGYAIRVAPEQLDLKRFERLTEEAAGALARGEAREALALQRDALSLWRGPALADLEHEPFAQNAIRRLEEILLVALEQRIDAELASAATGNWSRSSGSWSRSIRPTSRSCRGSCSPCTDAGARQTLSTSTD